jgi:hypothetical protein
MPPSSWQRPLLPLNIQVAVLVKVRLPTYQKTWCHIPEDHNLKKLTNYVIFNLKDEKVKSSMYTTYVWETRGIAPLFLTISMTEMIAVKYSVKKQMDFSDV